MNFPRLNFIARLVGANRKPPAQAHDHTVAQTKCAQTRPVPLVRVPDDLMPHLDTLHLGSVTFNRKTLKRDPRDLRFVMARLAQRGLATSTTTTKGDTTFTITSQGRDCLTHTYAQRTIENAPCWARRASYVTVDGDPDEKHGPTWIVFCHTCHATVASFSGRERQRNVNAAWVKRDTHHAEHVTAACDEFIAITATRRQEATS